MFVQEQGIVLSLRPFGDADYIVNFFGEKYGKQAGIAKSARSSRKRFGGLMTGTILDMQYRTRSYSEVVFFKEIQPALTHLEWRKEFDMMVCVMFALELAAKTLAEAQPAERKFALLKNFMSTIEFSRWREQFFEWEFAWLAECGWEWQGERPAITKKNALSTFNFIYVKSCEEIFAKGINRILFNFF